MRPLQLCRERLERLLMLLDLTAGKSSIRDLSRTYGINEWEAKQAEALGWVKITIRKPPTGRPSTIVEKLSNSPYAKLPPWRGDIPLQISWQHERFVHAYLTGCRACDARTAYLATYPKARSKDGASASAHRLLKHPDVRAALAWIRACMDGDFPAHEKHAYPKSAAEIRAIFKRLGYWRIRQL